MYYQIVRILIIMKSNNGFIEVFEITSSGIIKYTKGDAFSEK